MAFLVVLVVINYQMLYFFIFVKTLRMVCLVAVVSVVYIRITQYSWTEEG